MVVVKSENADTFLSRPSSEISLVLIYGADAGFVSERLRLAIKGAGVDTKDPFQLVRLDGGDIASDSNRLMDEINTIGLFGSARIVIIELGAADIAPALEIALQESQRDWRIFIEAGALKKDSPVRKFCERHRSAVAIECSQDSERDLERLLDISLREAALTIDDDAKSLFLNSLGSDRLSTRSEVEKLMTYAHGATRLEINDIESIASDASSIALERTVNFAFSGDMVGVEESWKRLMTSGTDGSTLISSALREALALHQYCSTSGKGGAYDGAAQRYNRGFGRKPLSPDALRKWTIEKANQALEILSLASGRARREPLLGQELAIRAIWSVSYLVRP